MIFAFSKQTALYTDLFAFTHAAFPLLAQTRGHKLMEYVERSADKYAVPSRLLIAITQTESDLNTYMHLTRITTALTILASGKLIRFGLIRCASYQFPPMIFISPVLILMWVRGFLRS